MKKIISTLFLLTFALAAFCQEETNGTIYIKHPFIDVVRKSATAYEHQDSAALKTMFADTARVWSSGLAKSIPAREAISMWMEDFKYFDSVTQKEVGYPDYLHYKDEDAKQVQSWWSLSGISKATGKKVVVPMVIFDLFDNSGKIVRETTYGDFSEWNKH